MQSDPLQQLKDVHFPADPSFWPLALGWWILGLLIVGLLVYGFIVGYQYYQARRPIRYARRQLAQLFLQVQSEDLSTSEFVTASNALLKRLYVHALGRHHYAQLAGPLWLAELDQQSNSNLFTNGPGAALGDHRFAKNFTDSNNVEADALYQALKGLLREVQP